jgi:hypothetical protein
MTETTKKTIVDMLREFARQSKRAGDIWEYSAASILDAAAELEDEPLLGGEECWTLRCESSKGKAVVVLTADQASRCREIVAASREDVR